MKTVNTMRSRAMLGAMLLLAGLQGLLGLGLRAQAPGTTPVTVSYETQMLHGRKYYVHIVEKGQTVYSISKAYKVESYDAVTHVDIHFLHPGDTVWLPCRGQFSAQAEQQEATTRNPQEPARQQLQQTAPPSSSRPTPQTTTPARGKQPSTAQPSAQPSATTTRQSSTATAQAAAPEVRKAGKVLNVSLMMPLHLDQLDQISTSKFDIEQRGKKKYRQFEFIEFYEGILMALDKLAERGTSVNLNVIDVNNGSAEAVGQAFSRVDTNHCDLIIALLLREAFEQAATLAQRHRIYIVNPMSARSEICAANPYVVKTQPSAAGMVGEVLATMKAERPKAHLYVVHSGSKAEKPMLDELKAQLDARGDIPYTLFNWSQSAKLAATLKATPSCNIVSIYSQGKDQDRVFSGNLLNKLSAIKTDSPALYTFADWTREYIDIDFAQLQLLSYHTFYTSWDMTNEVHVQFLQEFRERYGTEPTSTLAATGYDLTLYIVGGLSRRNTDFWQSPSQSSPQLIQPLHLSRPTAGLENDKSQLYVMQGLRFVPTEPIK